ncbi:DUF3019 domain-containing protein [Pseudoalteromonas sp. MMG013]|uniref:DUF3019 domain-containing protein n=1 Tax=Pseudoalteromonas aurantia 208 TaxID=1314867 RepID=A0ABR9E7T9_9GAMM|nr:MULTISPECIES: DUF3019 domain-containing protein [Pseudoalteromonas]MBE0367058.1 hypothetical protein [Pseudoalteromonas aurantia 208]MBQ4847504.1 DUF3019 domain-containing protein [Pseudoalteromonas sp. MMG005]MBQ4864347.1 DUF3019 domain-containing protein [Pseudoalteromonas sp. MMG013]
MYFKLVSVNALTLIAGMSVHQPVLANGEGATEILHAAPSKCVALNEGRTCYADVKFSINTPVVGDYCIRESTSKKILQCWAQSQSFEFVLGFGSAESMSYELISKSQRDVLAVTTIEVNWVHKIRTKKRRWRLF